VAVGALIGIRASRPELELDDADDFDDDVDGEVDEADEANDRDGEADDRAEDADGAVRSLGDAAADAELPGRG
jgi:hypothetical protein